MHVYSLCRLQVRIECGDSHSIAVTNLGQLWGWGPCGSGRLGFTDADTGAGGQLKAEPKLIDYFVKNGGLECEILSLGSAHTVTSLC